MHAPVPVPGTLVWIRRRRWRVEAARREGHVVRFDVVHRDRRVTFLAPFDRPDAISGSSRPRRVSPRRAIAELAAAAASASGVREPASLIDARIDILPYQIEPAVAVTSGVRRILIADEVGLGKTIQAALIVAELARRSPAMRAMVLVPATLIAQWQDELERRFGLAVRIAGRRELEALALESSRHRNPWTRCGIWLASADYLKQPHIVGSLPRAPWDLVVVDEAHDACGDSDRHAVCQAIARRARHVVLLTATPHSGDASRFARLEALGSLSTLEDKLVIFRRTRTELGTSRIRRVRWRRVRLSAAETRVLDALRDFERATLAAAGRDREHAALLLLSVFRKRALSTMASLDASLARRLTVVEHAGQAPAVLRQLSLDFEDIRDEFGEDEEAGLAAETGLARADERTRLSRLRLLVRAAIANESKLLALNGLLQRTRESVVVFTEFRHSLFAIERRLSPHRRVVTLHGGQSAEERARSLDRLTRGDASVLVATDVAGQGLNLQHQGRWVVCLELPWNPARLEQRIGRVDRIGQTRAVHATFLVARHDAETGLLLRLASRALTAQQVLGDDVLPDAAPPDLMTVAKRVFDAEAVDSDAPPATSHRVTMGSSTLWRRTGRAAARLVSRRRVLAGRWRHGVVHGRRPRLTTLRRPPAGVPRLTGAIAVVSVPIVDLTGDVLERRLLPIVGPLSEWTSSPDLVGRTVSRRHRLERWIRIRREQLAAIEEALAEEVRVTSGTGEIQPGLFGGLEVRRAERARHDVDDLIRSMHARALEYRTQTSIALGKPTLEFILCMPS